VASFVVWVAVDEQGSNEAEMLESVPTPSEQRRETAEAAALGRPDKKQKKASKETRRQS